jgi:predicted MPP superfamily phosphohydrolase
LLAGAAAIGGLATDAWFIEPRWIEVEHVTVPITGLGSGWQDATVALLSDTHCGPFTAPDRIGHAVDITNRLQPDVVLLLGDYVHRGAQYIAPGIAPFGELQSRHGCFGVLGNHDHWDGLDASLRALRGARVEPLVNRSVTLRRGGDPLVIAGVGDFMEDDQLLERALVGSPERAPRLLMSHNPDYAEQMSEDVRVDLMVSGHTHGGQVHIPFFGAPILPSMHGMKYQQGMVQGPHCRVYVTRGVSTISPPVRFLCRPEITLLRLVAV